MMKTMSITTKPSVGLRHRQIRIEGNPCSRGNRIAIAMLCLSTSFIVSCGGTDPGARVTQPSDKTDDEKVLNLYICGRLFGARHYFVF